MAEIVDTMIYVCEKYPYKHDLSKAKLNKLIYLADWKSAIDNDSQITPIKWYFNNYGPYVDDIEFIALTNPEIFQIKNCTTMYGNKKQVISLVGEFNYNLSEQEINILDFVITKMAPLSWNKFIKMIYSTYPILKSNRYEELDLVQLAHEYKAI